MVEMHCVSGSDNSEAGLNTRFFRDRKTKIYDKLKKGNERFAANFKNADTMPPLVSSSQQDFSFFAITR